MNKSYIFAILGLVILGYGLYYVSDKQASNVGQANIADLIANPNNTNSSSNETPNMNQPENNLVAQSGDMVAVQYTGKLTDGTVFDSSIPRGQPFVFPLGAGAVIAGWDKGIVGMKVGEKKTLTIPAADGYGAAGVTNPQTGEVVIPPNATLIFDVEIVDIQR